MATLLKNDVVRETYSVFDRKGNKIIVTLKAGDMLEFRPKGRRITYEIPLASCMNLAMIQFLQDNYKNKLQTYKQRKAAGLRAKKPRQPARVFSKQFYEACKY